MSKASTAKALINLPRIKSCSLCLSSLESVYYSSTPTKTLYELAWTICELNQKIGKAVDAKVIFSLAAVVLGWLLAQGSNFLKDQWTTKKLCNGLFTELEDIQEQLERVIKLHIRQLQIFAHEGMEPTSSFPIQNMFFQQNFKVVFSRLNRSQRISYQLIHLSLESLSKRNVELEKLFAEGYKEFRIGKDRKKVLNALNVWGENVIAIYKAAMTIRWYINHHLKNPSDPALKELSHIHESYLRYLEGVDNEVPKILDGAKKINKKDLEKTYNPKLFPITSTT